MLVTKLLLGSSREMRTSRDARGHRALKRTPTRPCRNESARCPDLILTIVMRWRETWRDSVASAAAAGLAWVLAQHLFGHSKPLFAAISAISAIICLSPGLPSRRGRPWQAFATAESTGRKLWRMASSAAAWTWPMQAPLSMWQLRCRRTSPRWPLRCLRRPCVCCPNAAYVRFAVRRPCLAWSLNQARPEGALPLLLALRHRLESRARRLHYLRPVAFRGAAGNRGRSGCGQGTLGLDVLVAEAGWSRHAPNPLLLVG
jgi:hypothetical protein